MVLIKLLNSSIPLKNFGLISSFLWFILFIVSTSTVGEGSVNASNPLKKRKMLSATCSLLEPAAVESSLKTWKKRKQVGNFTFGDRIFARQKDV